MNYIFIFSLLQDNYFKIYKFSLKLGFYSYFTGCKAVQLH